jgi:hypothetical protein
MNGRVYDYNLGRFLSVDPFIQDPGNSQSMNPYSYIMNNPLAGTDPSGYVSSYSGCDLYCGSDQQINSARYGEASSDNGKTKNQGTKNGSNRREPVEEIDNKETGKNSFQDQFSNPTDMVEHLEDKYSAEYIDAKDENIGIFELDYTKTETKIIKLRDRSYTEYYFTGSLEEAELEPSISDFNLRDGKRGLKEQGKIATLKKSINEAIVNVYKVDFDVYQSTSRRSGNFVTFEFDFRKGKVVEGSHFPRLFDSNKIVNTWFTSTNISTQYWIRRNALPSYVKRTDMNTINHWKNATK